MKNTIIFDLDGTLLNTLEDLYLSTNYAIAQFSYPQRTLDEVRQFVGNGVAKLIERAIPNGLQNPNYEKCLAIFKENYSKTMLNHTKPYDGIIELLGELKSSGYKIGVVSNKFDTAVKNLCKLYFKDLVEVAIGESETTRKKPYPDGVLKAIKELGSNLENAIYAGDSNVDVETAHNANLKCIGVLWGFRDRGNLTQAGADYIITHPSEILTIIKSA